MIPVAAYRSPYLSPYLSANGGVPINLLVTGDSWMDGLESALDASVPNLTQDNIATSAEKLYGANQIMADLTARLASPAFTYDTAIIEGGANDWLADPTGFTLALWKSAYVTMIDQCFAAGIPNVCAVSAVVVGDVWGTPGNVWYDMVQLNTDIPAIWDEFDTWLEAYCESVGAKFINLNQLPFAQNQVPEAGMTSAAHPDASGNATLAEYIFKPVLQAPTPVVTTAVTVTRARPNKSLLTVADMTRITQVVNDLDAEWDSAVELWLLDQTDVTASGNALTGLKDGTVLSPYLAAAPATVTHDSTPGALGIALEASEYLRQTIAPSEIGRTLSVGMMFQARSSFAASAAVMGVEHSFGADMFEMSFVLGASVRGLGLTDTGSQYAESSTNPIDLIGKFVELRTVESGSGQIVTVYESGVATDSGTTNAISRTYGGTVPTYPIAFLAVNYGGTYAGATAVTNTLGAIAITDGTTTPATWAAAIEA